MNGKVWWCARRLTGLQSEDESRILQRAKQKEERHENGTLESRPETDWHDWVPSGVGHFIFWVQISGVQLALASVGLGLPLHLQLPLSP